MHRNLLVRYPGELKDNLGFIQGVIVIISNYSTPKRLKVTYSTSRWKRKHASLIKKRRVARSKPLSGFVGEAGFGIQSNEVKNERRHRYPSP